MIRAGGRAAEPALTTPDLIVLSLLCEGPMHGYQLNRELERRDVRDWGGISRPQVYYSLDKLERAGLLEPAGDPLPSAGPEKRSYRTNAAGRAALADALESERWPNQRTIPPFLTWMAMSGWARRPAVRRQVERRREFLLKELSRERGTLADLARGSGATAEAARLMVELTISHFETELDWLKKVARTLESKDTRRERRS
jgi:DNA-binding PadR family transcriptional regulator